MSFSKSEIQSLHSKLNIALKKFADENNLNVSGFGIKYSTVEKEFTCAKITFASKDTAAHVPGVSTLDPRYSQDLRRNGLFVGLDSTMVGTELVLPGKGDRNDFTFVGMRASKAVAVCKQDGKPYLWDAKFMARAIAMQAAK